ncbi:hypothetical protein KQH90_08420 [Anaerosalibacter bizertensis]|uniref:hypothetical protein n=1 Tax=Anaerosalibacter bizertensis TaxID=932217 RepID=UPI001C0F0F63|nr:hypothetical protein [Anaerosalibacter bizertensis]MBU5294059.1 hypothetical protein [Anaerosalibacter bizertensis]
MTKKVLSLILIGVLAMTIFVGCAKDEAPKTDEPKEGEEKTSEEATGGELKDGNYLVKLPVSDHMNYPMATMEVKNGEISSFDYNEYLADSGEAKNPDNYSYEEGLEVIKNLNEQFMDKKDVESIDYDAVSGATHTKESFKEVVASLIEKAEKGEVYEPAYKDGEYEAKAGEESHGWLSEIKIVVKEGTIVGVDFKDVAVEDMEGEKVVLDEETKEPVMEDEETPKTEPTNIKKGDVKSLENYSYLPSFDTIKELTKQIIDNNGIEDLELDGISGATNTKNILIELATKALEDAK